jgi:hypothetical protein
MEMLSDSIVGVNICVPQILANQIFRQRAQEENRARLASNFPFDASTQASLNTPRRQLYANQSIKPT